ncbi:outer membrane beta-barrel protein [Limibacter armeniacum]|uniref:outer membrane beta-barrel protein n=1 Tax=Limibacter armeniacum TaxID=466084 RepID=UPI002FE568DF
MRKLWMAALCFFAGVSSVMAQEEDTTKHQLKIEGYTDVYFAAFSDELEPNALQKFTTVSPRDRRFGLNALQMQVGYESEQVRGSFTLHYGDIAQATWSETFNMIQEANMGIELKDGLWLDAGFFSTHIGTESYLPKNNWLSSTTVATYNEPFYQSGARLSWEGSEKFSAELWVVSGYNFFLDANDAKSVGALFSWNIAKGHSLTYTNLFGRESLDEAPVKQFRTYQNLYYNGQLSDRLLLTVGGDFGTQTNSVLDNPQETAIMYNALTVIRWQFDKNLSVTARGEVFNDKDGFISGLYMEDTENIQGLQIYGLTLGGEYRPMPNAFVRVETRYIQTEDELEIFTQDGSQTNQRWEAMLTMGYTFDRLFRW